MRILIAYSSKNGTTYNCARLLAEKLPSSLEVKVENLAESTPDANEYDIVVIGGAIRMEKLDKRVRRFLKVNKNALSEKPCAVFILCGFPENFDEYSETQLPRGFTPSLGVHHFGGELKPNKLRGFDKLVVGMMRSTIRSRELGEKATESFTLPELIPENIALLAEKIRNTAFNQ